jgi:site-specific recombinase XerD
MPNRVLLGPWIRRFLLEHIIAERNLSHNTQTSYRDTLVLLLPFIRTHYKRPLEGLLIDDVSPQIVRLFLAHLESVRSCSVATRNQRLAAIHSLARFIGLRSPEHLGWSAEVRAIPFKKTAEPVVGYLDKAEMDAMLQIINRRTVLGNRNFSCFSTTRGRGRTKQHMCTQPTSPSENPHRSGLRARGTRFEYAHSGHTLLRS